jgi:hypothetical protein
LPCVLESDGAFSLDHTVAVAEWIHVTKPNGWESIPYDPSRSADDVLLFQPRCRLEAVMSAVTTTRFISMPWGGPRGLYGSYEPRGPHGLAGSMDPMGPMGPMGPYGPRCSQACSSCLSVFMYLRLCLCSCIQPKGVFVFDRSAYVAYVGVPQEDWREIIVESRFVAIGKLLGH